MNGYIKDLRKIVGHRPLIMCGSAVVLINEHGQILLQRRSDNDTWGLIGGSLELGENLEETAAREAFEEVGLRVGSLDVFKIYSGKELYYKYPNKDEVYNVVAVYLCSDFTGEIEIDNEESKDARFFSVDSLPEKLNPPEKIIFKDIIQRFGESSPLGDKVI